MIFLCLLASLIFSRCEAPVGHTAEGLEGSWHMTWSYGEEKLYSEIQINGSLANIKAYGDASSTLLSEYSEASFDVEFDDLYLVLTNRQSQIPLRYLIVERRPDYIQLSYLNEIDIVLKRNSP